MLEGLASRKMEDMKIRAALAGVKLGDGKPGRREERRVSQKDLFEIMSRGPSGGIVPVKPRREGTN